MFGAGDIMVNSVHRQAVERLGPKLQVEAVAEDGTVEAVSVKDARAFAVGVQWHPEYWVNSDSASATIFRAFGDAVRAHAGARLGARTAARCVVAGMKPRRLVIAGMGLDGLTNWEDRPSFFLDTIARFDDIRMGDPAYFTVQFMKTMKIDRVAAKLLLEAVGQGGAVDLSRIAVPTLVLCGDEDRDNGSPEALAAALPDGHFAPVPGTHMSSVTRPELAKAIIGFLAA